MPNACLPALPLVLLSGGALADFAKITDAAQFREIVRGKTLSRPMIRLEVTPEGRISGRGLTWDVEGEWSWQGEYFCRDLYWGGDALGYNCQEVHVKGGRIRFTSDRGSGDYAVFRLDPK